MWNLFLLVFDYYKSFREILISIRVNKFNYEVTRNIINVINIEIVYLKLKYLISEMSLTCLCSCFIKCSKLQLLVGAFDCK